MMAGTDSTSSSLRAPHCSARRSHLARPPCTPTLRAPLPCVMRPAVALPQTDRRKPLQHLTLASLRGWSVRVLTHAQLMRGVGLALRRTAKLAVLRQEQLQRRLQMVQEMCRALSARPKSLRQCLAEVGDMYLPFAAARNRVADWRLGADCRFLARTLLIHSRSYWIGARTNWV